ncbi:MAG TPA: dihydroneopterin aldolase [Actinomycetota bacterium]|nr:dihydroneopterin aldolase [Actinomycetota bacterium]
MSDRISIRGLVVETRIGVTDQERSRPQDVSIDVHIDVDLRGAGETDDLALTVDYDALVSSIARLVRTNECLLLERLAAQICDLVAAKNAVDGVTVEVRKVDVPVNEEVSGVSVRVARPGRGTS